MIRQKNYILLVEEDANDRHILHRSFEEIHWSSRLMLVDSAEEAIQYLGSVPDDLLPSLIVLDHNRPLSNSTEVLMRLKQVDACKNIPVVLYSASMSSLLAYRLTSLGAHCCFYKPKDSLSAVSLARALKTIAEGHQQVQHEVSLN